MKSIKNISYRAIVLVALMTMTQLSTLAYDFTVGGIYYNILSNKKHTVSVTYKDPRTDQMITKSAYSGKVVIPNTVTHNGVKYTVTEIGTKAFRFANNMSSVTLPNTIKTIRAFAVNMTGIVSINIPASVSKIEDGAFFQARKLKTITVSPHNPYFKVEKDVLFNKKMTTLIYCTRGKVRKSYTVPSTVRKISDLAFAECTIYKITVNSNVTEFVGDPFNAIHFYESVNRTSNNAKREKNCGIPGWPGVCKQDKL